MYRGLNGVHWGRFTTSGSATAFRRRRASSRKIDGPGKALHRGHNIPLFVSVLLSLPFDFLSCLFGPQPNLFW